jgi:subtilisin family serine protease
LMRRSYLVIEDMSATRSRSSPRLDQLETAAADTQPSEIVVSEAELSEREANRLRRMGATLAPDDVEIYLIDPVSERDGTGPEPDWGLEQVGALASPLTGAGVTVAVLDTGIDRNHPAFQGMTLIEEDFTGTGNGDKKGHGTHCAGTIFGRPVDGQRIGVAPGVTKAYIGKVIPDPASGVPSTSGMAVRGLSWAIDQGVDIISMSIGIDLTKTSERLSLSMNPRAADALALQSYADLVRAFDALMAKAQLQKPLNGGIVVVAAAGNSSEKPHFDVTASLPANAKHVISVGALEKTPAGLAIASFSNSFPRISAPGVGITSAWPGGKLKSMDGTSMACPHVAGIAALWWERVRHMGLPPTADIVNVQMMHAATLQRHKVAGAWDNEDYGIGVAFAPIEA